MPTEFNLIWPLSKTVPILRLCRSHDHWPNTIFWFDRSATTNIHLPLPRIIAWYQKNHGWISGLTKCYGRAAGWVWTQVSVWDNLTSATPSLPAAPHTHTTLTQALLHIPSSPNIVLNTLSHKQKPYSPQARWKTLEGSLKKWQTREMHFFTITDKSKSL